MVQELGSLISNRYRVKYVLEQAPLEVVYLSQDEAKNNQNCVLRKFSSSQPLLTSITEEKFRYDLNKIQTLKHPQIQHIEEFFKYNENNSEHLFVVHNYIEGQTYKDLLADCSSLAEAEVIDLLNKILPVLSYLHGQQITHGNISPQNILLRNHDKLPVLINFGVMIDILAYLGNTSTSKKLLDVVRTLSPIEISSEIGEDLYALAITAVILLTGQKIEVLFNASTQTWDWENWKLVSDQLTSVLNRMLSVQPIHRFESADAVLQALNYSHTPTNTSVPPTVFPTSPPPVPVMANYQAPLQPNINVISPSPVKPQSGLLGWQIAFIVGGVLGLIVTTGVAYWYTQRRPSQSLEKTPQPTSQPTPTLAITPTPLPTEAVSISQQQATDLINTWLSAKREIFAPPYNRQVAAAILTGELYDKTLGSDGTINWLQTNNAKYEYGVQKIESVDRFGQNGNEATIQVKVTEQRTLLKNGRVDSDETDFKTRVVTYNLLFLDGRWKIASFHIIN